MDRDRYRSELNLGDTAAAAVSIWNFLKLEEEEEIELIIYIYLFFKDRTFIYEIRIFNFYVIY